MIQVLKDDWLWLRSQFIKDIVYQVLTKEHFPAFLAYNFLLDEPQFQLSPLEECRDYKWRDKLSIWLLSQTESQQQQRWEHSAGYESILSAGERKE